LALAGRVQELARYRSEFFGRLQAVLGKRKDVQIVGDRFVFSSEVLFPSASDEVSADGMIQLTRLAETLKALATDMPGDLPWVLQVDGHTDRRPISNARFPSNWELSTARALAIVKFLRSQGIPPERLAATGYGEFHPLDARNTEDAHARNRRIELKLTSR
ncbi:MAG: OmpA family protein, partial [Thauera sp.]|nr:OmpA family protein [Thauera sp.]